MKLQKLTIYNIASIEHAEIEFDKGALAEDPLFLITGRTGAGKTTILNAICLALYDDVPCLTGVKDDRNREDDLRITSPGQLMRKGSKKAEVTLTFQCGEVGYTAIWEAHYSQRKVKGEQRKLLLSRSLINNATGEALTKKTEINAQIRASVGLTFEQFTRTTMLAQGQFAAFMRADEKDKADILEKLTGTEIYTRIGQKVFELMKGAEALHSRLSADISEIKLLAREEIEDIEEKIKAKKLEVIKASLRIAAIDRQLEWLRGYESRKKDLEQTQSDFDRLTAIAGSDAHKSKISGIERYDSTADIRGKITLSGEMQKHIAELSAALDSFRQNKAIEIADGLCHIKNKIAEDLDRYKGLKEKVEEMEPMARVYADMQRIDEKSAQLKSLIDKYSATDALEKSVGKDLAKSQQAEVPLKKNIEAIEGKIASIDSALKNIDSRLSGHDRKALTSGKAVVDNEMLRITHIIQLHETLCSRRRDLGETRERSAKNAEVLKSAIKEFADIGSRMPRLAADYERCRAFLDGQKTLADHIGQLRGLYAESHTCPLCGNPHAEMLTDDTINGMLDEAKKNADEANNILVDAKARHKSLKKDITTLKKRAEELIEEEDRRRKLVDGTISDIKALGCSDPDEIIMEALKRDYEDLEKKSNDYEKKITEVDKLMTLRNENTKEREKNIDNKEKAVEKLLNQQHKTLQLSGRLSQLQDSLKDNHKDIEAGIEQLTEMTSTQLTVEEFEPVVETLKRESEKYSHLKESLSHCEREIEESIKELKSCNTLIHNDFRCYVDRRMPSPKELVDPDVKISEYGRALSRMAGEIATCETQLIELNRQIDAFFEEAPISRGEVNEIAMTPGDALTQWRAEVKDVAEKLTRAEGALTVIQKQIADHNESKPEIAEEATIDSLSSEKKQTEETRDNAKEEKNNLSNLLNENERLQKAYQARIAQREEAGVHLNEWRQLNNVFGSADGARFRAIAQSYVLRALLVSANTYLSWLSSRYMLDCKDGSLSIDVIDLIHGNTVRNVSLLSGGESFVVSLALALGLSAISKDKIDVDILFIDEGFGTLDQETLETVIETLDTLHRRGGRRIGIISHVAQLAERIPTQIRLMPAGPGLSRVVIA